MSDEVAEEIKCDILLFFATQTEREQLAAGSIESGHCFEERSDPRVGSYFTLGTIGPNRVRAVRTRMGSFFHRASASQAIGLLAASSATSIIQLGMAFGIDRNVQKHGDVLVSDWIYPYDYRIVRHAEGETGQPESYVFDYTETRRFQSKRSLLTAFEREKIRGDHPFKIHFGGMLSGGSRIQSRLYLRELLGAISGGRTPTGFIGGEMEGVGLLAASPKGEPVWIVVKGISDFADDRRNDEIESARPQACLNAVRFVLAALPRMI